jgi:hypothetical protein
MVEDLDQIRRNWKTNEFFEKFAKQVQSMTNPKLKLLKEGMVEAFLKKMRMQVQKHNKRYILPYKRYSPSGLCRMANWSGGCASPKGW